MRKNRHALWFALLLGPAAMAGSIHMRPTTVILPAGQSAAVLTVTNEGDTPLNAQVRVFGWSQSQNKDDLSPTEKLVASPPMTTIPPKQSQAIRLVRTGKGAATQQESYRVLIDEIVDQSPTASNVAGVAVQMRYSVPVFVIPRNTAPAKLAVSAELVGNALRVNANNTGGAYAQAANISVKYADGVSTPVAPGLLGYVLPGQSMQWSLTVPANAQAKGRPTRMNAFVNNQELQVDL